MLAEMIFAVALIAGGIGALSNAFAGDRSATTAWLAAIRAARAAIPDRGGWNAPATRSRVTWDIGGQTFVGTGIGSEKGLAVSYRSGNQTGLAI
jgi:hypothetical protein